MFKRPLPLLGALVFAFAAQGCGDDPAGATGADVCAAQCAYEARCGRPLAGPQCVPACEEESALAASNVRTEALAAFEQCYETLACDTSDDTCIAGALQAVGSSWDTDPLYATCQARYAECSGGDYAHESCFFAPVMTEQGRARLQACLLKPCEELAACVSADLGF